MQPDETLAQYGPAALALDTRTDLPAQAEAGLAGLAALVAQCMAGEDRTSRMGTLADFMMDDQSMATAGAALSCRRTDVESHLTRLGGVQGLGPEVPKLRRMLSATQQLTTSPGAPGGGVPLAVELEYDLPSGVHVPRGWVVQRSGIYVLVTKDGLQSPELVSTRPILPTAILREAQTGAESVQVEWRRRGSREWDRFVVPAGRVQDPRTLTTIGSNAGAPVAAHNAKNLARFLHDTVEASEALPTATAQRSCGWLPGQNAYLWGRTLITEQGQIDADSPPTLWGPHHGVLTADESSEVVTAMHARGSFDAWALAVGAVLESPAAAACLYGSVAACALALLEVQNPIIDWSGLSSTGKTTLLWMGASVWGQPGDRGGLIQSWETTPYRLEQSAALSCDLPLFLDDTKRAPNYEALESIVYMYSHGIGKGRGGLDGNSRPTLRWRGSLMSTGEGRILARGTSGGSHARALQIEDAPFPHLNKHSVESFRASLLENYGHAGPMVVEWLLRNRAAWPALRERHEAECAQWRGRFDSGVGVRLGRAVAVLKIGQLLCHGEGDKRGALGLARPGLDPLARAADWIAASAGEADRATVALADLHGWMSQHQAEFWGRHVTDSNGPRQPHLGWAGSWVPEESWAEVAFVKKAMERILRHLGHHPEEIIRTWADRGWLNCESGRTTRKVTVGTTERPRCVCVARVAVDGVG